MEYETLRAEILIRATARYQFVGFITAATALIGAGIGLSTYGLKTWILVGLERPGSGRLRGYHTMSFPRQERSSP
jgi:hypothetical protein